MSQKIRREVHLSLRPGGRRCLAWTYLLVLAMMLILGLLSGCGTGNPYPAGSFERAQRHYENKKYTEAVKALDTYVRQNPTDSLAAEAQYLKAVSYVELREFPLAAVEFQILRKDYPTSPRVEDSLFMEGVAYYKQIGRIERDISGAYDARLQFLKFSQEFPYSERMPEVREYMLEISDLMVRKRLGAVKVYLQLGRKEAAAITLDVILADEPTSNLIDLVLVWRADVAVKLDDDELAMLMYERILNEFPESEYTDLAQNGIRKIRDKWEEEAY